MKLDIRVLFKKCTFQLIMFIITFIISLWFLCGNTFAYGIEIWFMLTLTGVIPPIIFGIALYRKYKFSNIKKTKSTINWFTTIITILLPIYYIATAFILLMTLLGKDITDYHYYKRFTSNNQYIAFPKKIPKSAENINYYYKLPFLQGGETNLLYYKDNTLTKEKVNKMFSKAIWIGAIKEDDRIDYILESNTPTMDEVFYNTNRIEGYLEDFTLYVFDASCDESGYCNHGNFLIAAYNDNTKEILYRYENW